MLCACDLSRSVTEVAVHESTLTCSKAVWGLKQVHLGAETSPRPSARTHARQSGRGRGRGRGSILDEYSRVPAQAATARIATSKTGVQQIPEPGHWRWGRDDVRLWLWAVRLCVHCQLCAAAAAPPPCKRRCRAKACSAVRCVCRMQVMLHARSGLLHVLPLSCPARALSSCSCSRRRRPRSPG